MFLCDLRKIATFIGSTCVNRMIYLSSENVKKIIILNRLLVKCTVVHSSFLVHFSYWFTIQKKKNVACTKTRNSFTHQFQLLCRCHFRCLYFCSSWNVCDFSESYSIQFIVFRPQRFLLMQHIVFAFIFNDNNFLLLFNFIIYFIFFIC